MVMVVHRAGGAGLFPSTVADFQFSDFPETRCTLTCFDSNRSLNNVYVEGSFITFLNGCVQREIPNRPWPSDRIGSVRIGSGRIGSDRAGSDRVGPDRIG